MLRRLLRTLVADEEHATADEAETLSDWPPPRTSRYSLHDYGCDS
jgi:hypothetical protein